MRVAEQLNSGAVTFVRQLELRREALKHAGAKNAQAGTGNGGLRVGVGKFAEIFFGPRIDRASCRIAAMIQIDTSNVAALERKANAVGFTDTYLLDRLFV